MEPLRVDKRPPRTNAPARDEASARRSSAAPGPEQAPEIAPEMLDEISEKVYRMFQEDLRIARERGFRIRQA